MLFDVLETLIFSIMRNTTPLLFAGVGILLLQRSGLLNLGQDGLISLSAVVAFASVSVTGSIALAILAAAFASIVLNSVYGFFVLKCESNQVVTGLVLNVFCLGLAAYIGSPFVGNSVESASQYVLPFVSRIPVMGNGFFSHDLFVYSSWILPFAAGWFLFKTKFGCVLRSVGENPAAAHALGYSPNHVRWLVLCLSAVLVGLAGSSLTLSIAPVLADGVSGGRGWIALALVVFASHRLGRLVAGAFLFGLTSVMQLGLQAAGVNIDPSLTASIPYVATIIGLVVMLKATGRENHSTPKSLGQNFSASK